MKRIVANEGAMKNENTLHTHVFSDGADGPLLFNQNGKSIYYQRCFRCGRDFGVGLNGGGWRAINVGLLQIDLLADWVSDRWLTEKCPGQPLWIQDAEARTMRHA
jgi:hypothetical protein